MRLRLPLSVLLVSLALAAGSRPAAADGAEPAPEIGRPAPDFTLPDLSGAPVRLGSYRGRKAVVINFWATWCVPCREEMPTLERLSRERRAVLEVLGVNLDVAGASSLARVRLFVRELSLTFLILLDPEFSVARQYRVRGIPSSFVIDRTGVVRYREVGYRDWTAGEAQAIVDDALRPR